MEEISTEVTDCNAYILDSTTLLATPSGSHRIEAKNKGLSGKIPVTIAQPKIQIYVEAALRLPYFALAITNVSKNVSITHSQLMPTDDKKSAKLLINGFVRKIIQFAVPSNRSRQGISGDIRFSTFDIPFKCIAKVDYLIEPDLCFDESPRTINFADSSYYGADTSQYSFVNSQFLNERILVELAAATIRDVGKKNDLSDFSNGNINRSVFRVIDESMVVELVLRVTQNQLVEVPASENKKSEGSESSNEGNSSNSSKGNKNDNGENNCKGGKDNIGSSDERDGRSGEGKKDNRDKRDDRGGKDKRDNRDDRDGGDKRDDRNDRDEKYNQQNKDDDYKEIGELKLSVPTRLMDQLKKYFTK